jgi:hypothetical protein
LAGIFGQIPLNTIGHKGSYNDGSITSFGQANIPLSEGTKSPDYALYEVCDNDTTDLRPTVAWEVGYSEGEKKLALDAARLLCLSHGMVRLVVTIKIAHKRNTQPRELARVTWSHWEVDPDALELVKDSNDIILDDPQPVPGLDQTYEAYISVKGGICRIVACVTQSYEV